MKSAVLALVMVLVGGCSALQSTDWGAFGSCMGSCLAAPQPASCVSCVAACVSQAPVSEQPMLLGRATAARAACGSDH